MKKESVKSESKKTISLLNPNWKLVPQEGSPSLFMESPGNTSMHFESPVIYWHSIILWGLSVEDFVSTAVVHTCMQEL